MQQQRKERLIILSPSDRSNRQLHSNQIQHGDHGRQQNSQVRSHMGLPQSIKALPKHLALLLFSHRHLKHK